jgi:hypothetical protein
MLSMRLMIYTLNYAFYVYIHENKGRILEIPP